VAGWREAPPAAAAIQTTSGKSEVVMDRSDLDCIGPSAADNSSKRGFTIVWTTPLTLEAEGPFRGRTVCVVYQFAPHGHQVRATAAVFTVDGKGSPAEKVSPAPMSEVSQGEFAKTIASPERSYKGQ
jgi:hypothetical protein